MNAQVLPTMEQLSKWVDWLNNCPYYVKAFVACFIAITLWRKLPQDIRLGRLKVGFPNQALWFVSITIGVLVSVHFAPGAPQNAPAKTYRDDVMFIGFVVGFMTRLVYVLALGWLESRFPKLKDLLDGSNGNGSKEQLTAPAMPQIIQPQQSQQTPKG